MSRPHFTPGKDPVPILQETGWAPGSVWTGGKSRPHRDSIPDSPARSSVAIPTELPIQSSVLSDFFYRTTRQFVCTAPQLSSKELLEHWRNGFRNVCKSSHAFSFKIKLKQILDELENILKEKFYTYKALRNKKLDKSAIVSTMPLKPTKNYRIFTVD